MGMVKEDILNTYWEVLDHARGIEKLTHQPKEVVNQSGDRNEWK